MICQDVGPPDADIILIGEAPGEYEERYGTPFYHKAPAGRMLRQMLSHSGIDYNQCYVTNVMNVRPPANNFKYFYDKNSPTKELEDGWRRLRDKCEQIKPKVIIPLGAEPLKALCNKSGIASWRGTWLSFRGINVLPTYHPSYVGRVYQDHPIVEMDFVKAVTQKPAEQPHMLLRPTLEDAVKWIDYIGSYSTRISFDIETIGRHIRCLGLAASVFDNSPRPICIPFIKFQSSDMLKPALGSTTVHLKSNAGPVGSYWSAKEEVAVLDAINKLFQSGIEVVGQNSICFDEPLLIDEMGLHIKNHHLDTMHAFHCLYPEFNMGLSFLCSIYTNYANYWTEKETENDESEWRYNCMDAIVTLDVSYKIEEELKEAELPI